MNHLYDCTGPSYQLTPGRAGAPDVLTAKSGPCPSVGDHVLAVTLGEKQHRYRVEAIDTDPPGFAWTAVVTVAPPAFTNP